MHFFLRLFFLACGLLFFGMGASLFLPHPVYAINYVCWCQDTDPVNGGGVCKIYTQDGAGKPFAAKADCTNFCKSLNDANGTSMRVGAADAVGNIISRAGYSSNDGNCPERKRTGYCWCQRPDLTCYHVADDKDEFGGYIISKPECDAYCGRQKFVSTNFDPLNNYVERFGKSRNADQCPPTVVGGYCWCLSGGKCTQAFLQDNGQPFAVANECNTYCTNHGGRSPNFDPLNAGFKDRAGAEVKGACPVNTLEGTCWCQTPDLRCTSYQKKDNGRYIEGQGDCDAFCRSKGAQSIWDKDTGKPIMRASKGSKARTCDIIAPSAPSAPSAGEYSAGGARALNFYNPLGKVDLFSYIARMLRGIIGIVGALALLTFSYGGMRFLLSRGDTGDVKAGRTIMLNAGKALLIIFGAVTFISLFLSLFNPLP